MPDPEVIVDIKAAGLCHSDVGALEDPSWMNIITAAPMYLGHEEAGVVSSLGAGVTQVKIGDRVGIWPLGEFGVIGYNRDGIYATKCVVPESYLVKIPDEVTFQQGAAATDAGMTSHHAIFEVGQAKAGMKIGIIGIGGLGVFGARMAVLAGCEVYAVDTNKEARTLAHELGCHAVYENIEDLADIDCHLIIDFAGFGVTTAKALDVCSSPGKVVLVGMGKLETTINTHNVIVRRIDLLGSVGGTAEDIRSVYDYFASGKFNPPMSKTTFDKIPEGLERLKRGEVKGRLVALL